MIAVSSLFHNRVRMISTYEAFVKKNQWLYLYGYIPSRILLIIINRFTHFATELGWTCRVLLVSQHCVNISTNYLIQYEFM